MRPTMWIKTSAIVVSALSLSASAAAGSLLSQQTKLGSDTEYAGDEFGHAVALDGSTAIVGANGDDGIAAEAGAAYLFLQSTSGWDLQQKLLPPAGSGGSYFGSAVAVSGDTAIVGAYGNSTLGSFAGAAYVFVRTGTTWSLQQVLTAPDGVAEDYFGFTVAVSGDTAAVGAFGRDESGSESGAAYVFERSGVTWTLQQKLLPPAGSPNADFGVSLALQNNILVLGAPGDVSGGTRTGSAYVFARSEASWSQTAKLVPNAGTAGDKFGRSVALDRETALIGAYQDDAKGANAGAGYVFVRSGSSWSLQQKLFAADGAAGDYAGWSVAINGERAVLGAFGTKTQGPNTGSVYVFDRSGVTWAESQKVSAFDAATNDVFGYAVAAGTSAGTSLALVGANGKSTHGTSSGAAYLLFSPPVNAPALGEHGAWLLGLLLSAFAYVVIRRRRGAALLVLGLFGLHACGGVGQKPTPEANASGEIEQRLDGVDDVPFLPSQDTSVLESQPDANFGTATTLDQNRALLQFEQAPLTAALGPTDYLVSAALEMTLAFSPLRDLPQSSDGFRLTQSWSEGGATFDCAIDADPTNAQAECSGPNAWSMVRTPNPWAVPGTARTTIPVVLSGVVRYDVTADVRAFVRGEATNFGWILSGSRPDEFSQFASRETTTPPRLVLSIRRCHPSECDDGNPCTQDTCSSAALCAHAPVEEGTPCNDGNACTLLDVCQAGACVGTTPVTCAATDACHVAGTCDPSSGLCLGLQAADDTLCDDGNACTQSDKCRSGVCVGSDPKTCASADGCHPGVCDSVTGNCSAPLACHLYGVGSISGTALDGLSVSPTTLEDGLSHNLVGGFGSAIAYTGVGNLYLATPDRGPNNGLDSYTDRYYLIEITMNGGAVNAALRGGAALSQVAGTPFTGLSSAFDATGSANSLRLDPEGLRVTPSGTFFVSDEYGPYVYEFGANGNRLRSLTLPSKFLIAHPNADGTAELPPGNTSGRQSNRGMEGLAITPDGTRLFGIMQSPLLQDGALDSSNNRIGTNNRIVEFDLLTGVTHEYLYPMVDKGYGVSEILAINDHQFLVDERDGKAGSSARFKRIYLIDVSSATDISGIASLPTSGIPSGVTPVTKKLFLDLLDSAYGLSGASFPEKIEGLAFGPDTPDGKHVLVVTNDNDFTVTNPNNFYLFTIDPNALPGYEPQTATFSTACITPSPVTCNASDECHLAGMCRPDDAACQPRNVTAGTPTSAQVAGDCRKKVCDGSGQVASEVDDTDVPADDNACTLDVCTNGVPSHPPVAAGQPCAAGGGTQCDGSGACVQCLAASDCPGTDTECSARTCIGGVCGVASAPNGLVLATQVAGDCHKMVCDGSGKTVSVVDDTDLPVDNNECTSDLCTNGVPSNPPVVVNTPCSAGYCDGAGTCSGCTSASQCPGSDSGCATRTCTAGACGFAYVPAGTAAGVQTAGDCQKSQCDGSGNLVSVADDTDVPADTTPGDCHSPQCSGGALVSVVNNNDIPNDGNACTNDLCSSGAPSHTNVAYGTSCGTDQICNGSGACSDWTFRVVRIGDGSASLSSAAWPVFIEERKVSDGSMVGVPLAMPTTASGKNQILTDSGVATSDGTLALSVDGRYLTLAGYAATVGTTGVASGTANRVVARISGAGTVDTSTVFTTFFSGNNIRSAVTVDGTGIWAAGGNGTAYLSFGTSGAGASVSSKNARVVGIYGNQLYFTSGSSSAYGLNKFATALPTGSASYTNESGFGAGTLSSYGFVMFTINGVDTLYVVDDGSSNPGLQKWTKSGGTWTRVTSYLVSGTSLYRCLTGAVQANGDVLLLATGSSTTGTNSFVVKVTDHNGTFTGSQIATPPVNEVFRGVAFSPHN